MRVLLEVFGLQLSLLVVAAVGEPKLSEELIFILLFFFSFGLQIFLPFQCLRFYIFLSIFGTE